MITASGDRLKLFSDILQYGLPILRPSVAYDEKSFAKRVTKEGVPGHLAEFVDKLAALPDFEAATLENALKAHANDKGFNPALLIHGLRVSTTGIEVGAGVYDILSILGKDESIRRVRNALAKAGPV